MCTFFGLRYSLKTNGLRNSYAIRSNVQKKESETKYDWYWTWNVLDPTIKWWYAIIVKQAKLGTLRLAPHTIEIVSEPSTPKIKLLLVKVSPLLRRQIFLFYFYNIWNVRNHFTLYLSDTEDEDNELLFEKHRTTDAHSPSSYISDH